MAIWGRLKQELDRASRMAQGAIDEGRVRLEVFRARQQADRSAQALGYAVYRARQGGTDIEPAEYERSAAEITRAEAEITRLESQLPNLRRDPASTTTRDDRPTAPPATAV